MIGGLKLIVENRKEFKLEDERGFTGGMKDGLRHGWGVVCWLNGDFYSGEWKDGWMEGKGTYFLANQDIYEGKFKKGLKDGKGAYMWRRGFRYEGEFKEGLPWGRGTYQGINQRFIDGIWKAGELMKEKNN